MPGFTKGGPSSRPPFGINEYLRSTQDLKFEGYTVAASTVPAVTIDGVAGQKILQRGVVMAKITSGVDSGKIGPYSVDTVGVTDGRSSTANIVGINDTFLPWQLMDRDVEVAVVYECTAVQAWCLEQKADLTFQALTNTTADTMRTAKGVNIHFH